MDLRNTPFLQGFLGATSPAGYQALGLQQQQLQALEQQRAWEQQFKQQQFTQNAMQFDQSMANADRRFGLDEQKFNLNQAGQAFDMERADARMGGDEAIFQALMQRMMPQAGMPGSPQMGPPSPNPPGPPQLDPRVAAQASPNMQQAALQLFQQQQERSQLAATMQVVQEMGGDFNDPAVRAMLAHSGLADAGVKMPFEGSASFGGIRRDAELQATMQRAQMMNSLLDDADRVVRAHAIDSSMPTEWMGTPYTLRLPGGEVRVTDQQTHQMALQQVFESRVQIAESLGQMGGQPQQQGGVPFAPGMAEPVNPFQPQAPVMPVDPRSTAAPTTQPLSERAQQAQAALEAARRIKQQGRQ